MTAPIKLLHLAPWVRTIGGVETLLAHHARTDAASGFDARQLALFDRGSGAEEISLGFSWKSTARGMRRKLRETCARQPGGVVVHHGAWGVPWLADVDASDRRVLFLQDSFQRYEHEMPFLTGWADGILCCSESSAQAIRQAWPAGARDRVAVPPQPITPPALPVPALPARKEIVIGYAGRVIRPHKAVDRLVPFVQAARRLGVVFRVEVMGDGPLRPELEKAFRGDPGVQFIGWQLREAYWARMRSWDFVVSFSDHEGGPITLLEAMASGAIPLYPTIGGSLGDDYAPRVDPRCHYPAGDPEAAARAFAELQALGADERARLRQRAIAVVQPHVGAGYERTFADLVHRIAALPRISRPATGTRVGRWTDFLPLGYVTRFAPQALQR